MVIVGSALAAIAITAYCLGFWILKCRHWWKSRKIAKLQAERAARVKVPVHEPDGE